MNHLERCAAKKASTTMSDARYAYLNQRKNEITTNLDESQVGQSTYDLFDAVYDYIGDKLIVGVSGTNVTPEFTRKLELLETLLFSMIEHSENLELLDEMEKSMVELEWTRTDKGMLN